MKKQTILSLFAAGIFFLAAVFTGCPSPTVTPSAPKDITITYDAGAKGTFENGESTITQSAKQGKTFDLITPTVTDSDIYTFVNYTIDDTDTVYKAGKTFKKDTTLVAHYAVISPTNLVITKDFHAEHVSLTWDHPSDLVTYKLKITDLTQSNPEPLQMLTADTKSKTFTLTHSHTYKIEVCAEYDSELSAYVEGTVNMVGFFTVTYDAGNKGNFNGQSTVTVQVDEGTPFTADKIPTINNQYVTIFEFDNYTIDDTDNQITANYTLTKDITLKANYTVIAPTNLTLTKKNEEATIMTVQFEHPSDQNIFTIEVTDITQNAGNLSSPKTITGAGKTNDVAGLKYSHTYNVTVKAVCEGVSSDSTPPVSITMETFYTVYYDAGLRGTINGSQTYSVQVDRGTPFTAVAPTIMSNYQNIFKFKHYIIDNDPSKILTDNYNVRSNISIQAVYYVVPPSNVKTYITEPFDLKVTFDHPIEDPAAKGVKFEILLEDITYQTPVAISEQQTAKIWTTNQLRYRHAYKVSVSTICESEESERIAIEFCPTEPANVPVLLLMYMDGDNNLNDPIFFDLNEAEYGLYQAGAAAENVKVFALFDGGPRQGDGYENQFGFEDTRLLELGPHSGEVYTVKQGQLYITQQGQLLSDTTIDRSYDADWLAVNEAEMNEKQTLKFFLEWATDRYNAGKIILQFSNHGGGPRSYMPKELILPNGEKTELNNMYGRRSMCWDDTTGGSECFLKTSDLSDVFDELGFGSTKQKIEMIMEDVCLGGSIEEAYEVKDYANYFLASPNNIPGFGFDYTNLVKTLCANANSSNLSEILGNAVIQQYAADYAWSDAQWLAYIKTNYPLPDSCPNSFQSLQDFAIWYYTYLIGEEGLTSEQASESIYRMALNISLQVNVSTLSLIDLSKLANLQTAIDGLAQELLDNASVNCSNIWADEQGNLVTNPDNAVYSLNRLVLIRGEALRPFDNIKYQGSYSWLYDIGTMLDTMAGIANIDGWTELLTQVTNVRQALVASVKACWRDGLFYGPTYSTIVDTNILCSNTNVPYGLTISGETVKIVNYNGQNYLDDGDYPSWYTDLKFGQDCKWNDLLQAIFPSN